MSVTDLAPAAHAGAAQRTVEILDHVLEQVREALARASVVPDPMVAAGELRALASAAWEGAQQIEPLATEHVLDVAAALVDDTAAGQEPAVLASGGDPRGDAPVAGYQPRHSASTPAVSPRTAPGDGEPTSLTVPRRRDETVPRRAGAVRGAGSGVPELVSARIPVGSTIADQLAALDALLSTSEHFLGDARPMLPTL